MHVIFSFILFGTPCILTQTNIQHCTSETSPYKNKSIKTIKLQTPILVCQETLYFETRKADRTEQFRTQANSFRPGPHYHAVVVKETTRPFYPLLVLSRIFWTVFNRKVTMVYSTLPSPNTQVFARHGQITTQKHIVQCCALWARTVTIICPRPAGPVQGAFNDSEINVMT